MEHRRDEPVDGDEDSKSKLAYDYGGDCEDEGDVADLAFHYFLHVLSTHGDPLLRGNSAVFIGSMLVGSLSCCSAEGTHTHTRALSPPPLLLSLPLSKESMADNASAL